MAAKTPEQKPHFSPSQLFKYSHCPEAYRRDYIEKERPPRSAVQARGTGMHHAAAANFRNRLEHGTALKTSDVVDMAVEKFDAEVKDGVSLNMEEHARGADVVIAEARDDLREIVHVHATEQAPSWNPIFVEKLVRIELPSAPRDLLGVIDLGATSVQSKKKGVVDFKTAKRSKSQSDADSSIQLTTYAVAFTAETGERPDFVALDSIIQLKTKTTRQLLLSERDDADLVALTNRINAVQHAIDAGSFPPTNPGAWQCSDKYCAYYRTCPFVNGGRAAQGD